ncbi:MAG: alkaline phosphatase family protein [Candidatus Aminicenantes bacterium]|nr:alkaline phosphatase family protein [Candidatus Aminicenantes bacterium]
MILRRRKKRVLVIGLDGVSYSLLRKFCQQRITPKIAEIISQGYLSLMKASLPEISAVSWTDFMTGTNSANHGIFGFTDLKTGSYELRFPNFKDVRVPTLWEKIGQQGKKSLVINQPATYPARPLNGILISGFVAIDLAKAVYPPQEIERLKKINYLIDVDPMAIRANRQLLWSDLKKTLESTKRALNLYWNEDWDYLEIVITGTDRLHHYFMKAAHRNDHPSHEAFLNYYREVDSFIGQIVDDFIKTKGSYDNIFLLSDHGFCELEKEVYLNSWLKKQGLLKFKNDEPQSLADIEDSSVAFALDPNRIYLHLKGKFPKGKIEVSERERWCEEIRRALLQLEHNGQKVVQAVYVAEEVYSGPLLPLGPDLIALSYPSFDLKGSIKKKEIFYDSDLEGMHTYDDAFFWTTAKEWENLKIADSHQIILEKLA